VGLSGAEFCILNQRYDRTGFFKRLAELERELGSASLEALIKG